MKLTRLSAYQPHTPNAPSDWRTQLGQIVVEIETDSGHRGIGVGGGGRAGIHVIETVLRDLLINRDCGDVESLHAEMCEHTSFYGRKGLVVMAISGVDLALWDVRGKALGQSVTKLLSSDCELPRQLPTYITAFGEDEIESSLSAGYRALKLHVEEMASLVQIATAFQRARQLAGPEVMLMVDAFGTWDIEKTLRIADAIGPYDVSWIEEPLPPSDLDGYEELMRRSPIPIAGGEHEYLADGFETLIRRGLHAILQPDINWCGGLTTMVQVYQMARTAGVRVCPHRGCEPFALPAIAALDDNPLAESGRSWFCCLRPPAQITGGSILLEEKPGFGVSIAPPPPNAAI